MLFDESDEYYEEPSAQYYQQGDVLLAPVVSLDSDAAGGPIALDIGVAARRTFWSAADLGRRTTGEAVLGPAMITTHDCALDKEFNRRYSSLRDTGLSIEAARTEAERDVTLDRLVTVAPIVPYDDAAPSAPQQLRTNAVIGFFPVCESLPRSIDGGVVDLARQTTLDRSVIVSRLGIISDPARATLLYALARYWAYRAPKLTYEIEAAIGRRIVGARKAPGGDLGIILTLDDGSEVRFLQAPEASRGGPERTGFPDTPP